MKVVNFAIAVVLSSILFLSIGSYLDRPTVEVSKHTHHCVRAYGVKGPLSCADAMSMKHEEVLIDS